MKILFKSPLAPMTTAALCSVSAIVLPTPWLLPCTLLALFFGNETLHEIKEARRCSR